MRKIGYIDGRRIKGGDFDLGLREIYWDPTKGTLQALMDKLTGTEAAPYTIVVPPGHFDAAQLVTAPPLSVKPWVNLKGHGGKARVTIFHNTPVTMLDASIPAGTNRWRMDGIRLETVTLTLLCTTGAHRLVVVLDDCPCNNQSPIITQGNAYGAAATMIELELHNLNIDRNIAPQMFQLTRLMATGCDLNGLYFTDSDAYIRSCDLFVGCNVVNAGVAGGWFEFSGSRIPEMDFNEGTSESVLATLCGGGNENVQCWSRLRGAADPNGILNWARFQQGATYYRWGTGLYLKTGIVGNPVWTLMT